MRLVEGQIVVDDEGRGSSGGWLSRLLRCRGDTTINLLGFRVPLYWTCVIAVFATLRFGVPGLVFFGILAGEMSYSGTLYVASTTLTCCYGAAAQ